MAHSTIIRVIIAVGSKIIYDITLTVFHFKDIYDVISIFKSHNTYEMCRDF